MFSERKKKKNMMIYIFETIYRLLNWIPQSESIIRQTCVKVAKVSSPFGLNANLIFMYNM
jgi:hypothetical protein